MIFIISSDNVNNIMNQSLKRNARKKKKRTHLKGRRNTRRINRRTNRKRKRKRNRKLVGGSTFHSGRADEKELKQIAKALQLHRGASSLEQEEEKTLLQIMAGLLSSNPDEKLTRERIIWVESLSPSDRISDSIKLEFSQKRLVMSHIFKLYNFNENQEACGRIIEDARLWTPRLCPIESGSKKITSLKPGDHVLIQRGIGGIQLYEHHGIFIGENDQSNPHGRIIHYKFGQAAQTGGGGAEAAKKKLAPLEIL